MKKNTKLAIALITLFSIFTLAACSESSSSSDFAVGCVSNEPVSGGVNFTNNCGFKTRVAIFDPLFRFDLEDGETTFIARTGLIGYGACKSPFKPKDDDGKFICD